MRVCQSGVYRKLGRCLLWLDVQKGTIGYWGRLGEALTTVHSKPCFGFLLLPFSEIPSSRLLLLCFAQSWVRALSATPLLCCISKLHVNGFPAVHQVAKCKVDKKFSWHSEGRRTDKRLWFCLHWSSNYCSSYWELESLQKVGLLVLILPGQGSVFHTSDLCFVKRASCFHSNGVH